MTKYLDKDGLETYETTVKVRLQNKQDKLQSGENIKTINNTSLLGSGDISVSTFSGSYNDLTNKPTIPTVPTNVSAFTNDSGYVTDTVTGDLTNLTTTTKTDLVSAINEVNQKHIMTAYFTNNYTLAANSTYYKLPINSSVSTGTKLTLDATNHNIVVGSGVSKVKVSAKVCYNTVASSGDKWLTVYRNSDSISANPRNLSGRDLIYATTFLVNVQPNDIIYFSVFGSKNDVIRADVAYSNITVEVVE